MEERKIYVSDKKVAPELIRSIPREYNLKATKKINDADDVVLIVDIQQPQSYLQYESVLNSHPSRDDVRVVLVCKNLNIDHLDKGFVKFSEWMDKLSLKKYVFIPEENWIGEFAETLNFTETGSPHKPAKSSRLVAATVPAIAVLPKYPSAVSFFHTRQLRNKYVENDLISKESDDEYIKNKKLVLLFAHYMSVRHVNSLFSRKMEEVLIEKLGLNTSHAVLKDRNKWWKRAYIRGKKYDAVARMMRDEVLDRNPSLKETRLPNTPKGSTDLDLMADLLRPVNLIEKSRFGSQDKIRNATELVDKVYDDLQQSWYGHQYSIKWVKDLTNNPKKVLPRGTTRVFARRVARG